MCAQALVCCDDYDEADPMGEIDENGQRRIMDIWLDPNFIKIRRKIRTGVYRLGVCQKCSVGGKK